MAKKDTELFDRLRQAGLRKQAAKALSAVNEKAGKKTQRAARAVATELRALVDEIDRRLPAAPASDSKGAKSGGTKAPASPRSRATTRRSTKSSGAGTRKPATAAPASRAARSSSRSRAGGTSRSRAARPAVPKAQAQTPNAPAPPQ